MNIYLLSVLITILVNLWSNIALKSKLRKLGYLDKSVISNKGAVLIANLISIFVPGLNILMSLAALFFTIRALNDDERLLGMYKGRMYSSKMIKRVYEKDTVNDKTLEDMFTLDGADEDIKKEELKKIDSQKRGFEAKRNYHSFMPQVPDFSEKEYEWAAALEYAKLVVDSISLETNLSDEDKEKLLSMLQHECKTELFGKDEPGDKVMKKILNVVK